MTVYVVSRLEFSAKGKYQATVVVGVADSWEVADRIVYEQRKNYDTVTCRWMAVPFVVKEK